MSDPCIIIIKYGRLNSVVQEIHIAAQGYIVSIGFHPLTEGLDDRCAFLRFQHVLRTCLIVKEYRIFKLIILDNLIEHIRLQNSRFRGGCIAEPVSPAVNSSRLGVLHIDIEILILLIQVPSIACTDDRKLHAAVLYCFPVYFSLVYRNIYAIGQGRTGHKLRCNGR